MEKSDGRFKKGRVPWNKGKKGIHISPKTEFKKGQYAMENHRNWKGGVHIMANDCVHLAQGNDTRVRRPRKVYEDNIGPIPKGYIVYHKDGDNHNDIPSNLIAVPRKYLIALNTDRISWKDIENNGKKG